MAPQKIKNDNGFNGSNIITIKKAEDTVFAD